MRPTGDAFLMLVRLMSAYELTERNPVERLRNLRKKCDIHGANEILECRNPKIKIAPVSGAIHWYFFLSFWTDMIFYDK